MLKSNNFPPEVISLFGQLEAYWHFAWGLRSFIKEPVTLEQSREIVRQRLQNREQSLLAVVKRAIYDNKASPYLKLLRLAGCEYGDFEKMVHSDGIESTLKKICEAGVYLSTEEFKGKNEVSRGGEVFKFKESDFDNPFLIRSLEASSGASRSSGTKITMNLDRQHYSAAHDIIVFDDHSILDSPFLVWMPILPAVAGLGAMLRTIKVGKPPVRWFSQVESRKSKPSLTKRLATYYAVYAGRVFGAAFAKPEYVGLEQAHKVANCMSELLKAGQGCVLWAPPSSAVRVCQVAVGGAARPVQ